MRSCRAGTEVLPGAPREALVPGEASELTPQRGRMRSIAAGSCSAGALGPVRSPSCRRLIERRRSRPMISSGLPRRRTWRAATRRASSCGSVRIASSCRPVTSLRAVRCVSWLVFVLLNGGQFARSGGWLARARRLLDDGRRDCPELGYVLVPTALLRAVEGDWPGAHAIASQAAEIGERFGEIDLMTLARNVQGRALIAQRRVGRGNGRARRGDGRGDRGRGVADGRRRRLLQRDRGVPAGLRRSPRAGVDGGADALVRLAAGAGPVHRRLLAASRRDHAAARRVDRRGRRRRSVQRNGCCVGARRPWAPPSTSRASCIGCAARSREPRRRTPRPAVSAASHSRAGPTATGAGAARRREGGDPARAGRGS